MKRKEPKLQSEGTKDADGPSVMETLFFMTCMVMKYGLLASVSWKLAVAIGMHGLLEDWRKEMLNRQHKGSNHD